MSMILIKQPTKESESNMFIYQNEKQRKSSEDIERRFPTIKDPDIREVYFQTMRTPEPSKYFQNTYSKNKKVMRNMSFQQEDIADYLNSADQYIKDMKVLYKNKARRTPLFNKVLSFKKPLNTAKTSTSVLLSKYKTLKVA
jgi:hypothetical protein